MPPLIEQHREELVELCRRFDAQHIELFGSAARGDFDPAGSDLDFLVAFRRDLQISPVDRYLGLMEGLEALFGRKINLVDVRAHRNPHFMAEARKSRVRLYAA